LLLKKLMLVSIILLLFLSNISLIVNAQQEEPPIWNANWEYRQEIILPISTDDQSTISQPIDIEVNFKNSCWGKSNELNSIRVVVWNGQNWQEIESQVYDTVFEKNKDIIKKCGLVFLIPAFANGKERYFVYYDSHEKEAASYTDHVSIEDSYYYYEPISSISAEGDYYKITEDGYVVFGVGQKGKVLYRSLSNNVVKMKPGSKEFGITNSESTVSFSFAYHKGFEDKDEISSDQKLVSKNINIDGNLMVEFVIISESDDKNLRTTVVYKYYYCPTENKRINANVKHQVFEECTVKGLTDVDGRYGAIISYQSKSERIEKMRFGEIYPFLHVYSEEGSIKEYNINTNPKGKEREWIISSKDECTLGENAWFSYDEGEKGLAQGVIFSQNKNIVKYPENEIDGMQIKVAEKEILNAIGTKMDYAAINFGRNSYKNGVHDLVIPAGFTVEYDAVFFTTQTGGYPEIAKESIIYQTLIKHRYKQKWDSDGQEDRNIYTLKVIPRFTARLFSHPFFSEITNLNLSEIYAELYKNGEYICTGHTQKTLIGAPKIIFPKLSEGEYFIKIMRKKSNDELSFIGFEKVNISTDKDVDIFCTWPRDIQIQITDQKNQKIKDVQLVIYSNNTIICSNLSNEVDENIFTVPFKFFKTYTLEGVYKGFKVINYEIPILKNKIEQSFEVYDLSFDIRDTYGFTPGVDAKIYLISNDMILPFEIYPQEIGNGKYLFEKIPAADYNLYILYASYSQVFPIKIPSEKEILDITFEAIYKLETSLFDSRGNAIEKNERHLAIYRESIKITDNISPDKIISLPPGEYNIYVYEKQDVIGFKNIFLTNDRKINIVTNVKSIIPNIITVLSIIFIIQIIVLLIFKKISLNSFLKLLTLSLILLSIMLPWWSLYASNAKINTEKTIEMFLSPASMIEEISYKNIVYPDMANIPDIFTNFLNGLVVILCAGFVLISLSFIPNIIYKKRFALILIVGSILFLILFAGAFIFGMSQITELTLGSLQNQGVLEVILPDKNIAYMQASWGVGTGFYLSIIAALTTLTAGVIDYLRKIKML
jgi:hypothetical protein